MLWLLKRKLTGGDSRRNSGRRSSEGSETPARAARISCCTSRQIRSADGGDVPAGPPGPVSAREDEGGSGREVIGESREQTILTQRTQGKRPECPLEKHRLVDSCKWQ